MKTYTPCLCQELALQGQLLYPCPTSTGQLRNGSAGPYPRAAASMAQPPRGAETFSQEHSAEDQREQSIV